MTDDFIQDATESLFQDKDLSFILVAAHFGSPYTHKVCNVPSRKHLAHFKRTLDKLYAELEEQYKRQEE